MRRWYLAGLAGVLCVAGCRPSLGLGYGDEQRGPSVVLTQAHGEILEPHLGLVFATAPMEARDSTTFTVSPAVDVFNDIATVDVKVMYDSMSLGVEAVIPHGPWSFSVGYALGVARYDAPTITPADAAALAAAQITNVQLSHDSIETTFNVRAQLRYAMKGVAIAVYAETGSNGSEGVLSYTYAPMGALSEGEMWRGEDVRYGATVSYNF